MLYMLGELAVLVFAKCSNVRNSIQAMQLKAGLDRFLDLVFFSIDFLVFEV